MDRLRLMTLNVNGIRAYDKRKRIVSRFIYSITAPSPDIFFLQETHSDKNIEKEWARDFKYRLYFNHDSASAGGLLIGIRKGIDCQIKKKVLLPFAMIMHCSIAGADYLLINVYLHPSKGYLGNCESVINTLQELYVVYSQFNVPRLIMGGDFNMVLDGKLDCISLKDHYHRSSSISKAFSEFCEETGLSDVWRTVHPDSRKYTHFSTKAAGSASRLDYIFVSDLMLNYLDSTHIGTLFITDHCPVYSEFLLNRNPKGIPFFRFPDYLLNDEQFKKDYTAHMEDFIKNNVMDVTPNARPRDGIIWDTMKAVTRGFTISRMAFDRKKGKIDPELIRRVTDLETKRDCCEDLQDFVDAAKEASLARDELDKLLQAKEQNNAHKASFNYYAYSDTCSKYFFRKIKGIPGALRHMFDTVQQRDVYTDEEILDICKTFYSNLYTRPSPSFVGLSNFFDCIPESGRLSDTDRQDLSEDIDLSELTASLHKMKKNSSPGFDGLTVSFYRTFWPLLGKWVLSSINDAFSEGQFTTDQRRGIIKLLPKRNKPPNRVANLRPISILNVDFKLLTKLLAVRMRDVMPSIIQPDQNGFIKHRYLGNNVLDIYSLMEVARNMEDAEDLVFFSVDIYKAFDSVSHCYLHTVMKELGFPPSFMRWVSVTQANVELRVANNNHLSDPIFPSCGVAQGCPLSPYLFLLVIESLANFIRADAQIDGFRFGVHEKKICLVADDTLIALKGSAKAFHRLKETLNHFHHVSGLSVNYEKSAVIYFSCEPPPWLKSPQLAQFPNCNIHEGFPYLGLNMYGSRALLLSNFNINPKIVDVVLSNRAAQTSSVTGRILQLKQLVGSKFVYSMLLLPSMSPKDFRVLKSQYVAHVWDSGRHKLAYERLLAPPHLGGFNMLDPIIQDKSLKFSWIPRLLTTMYDMQFWKIQLTDSFLYPVF